MRTKNGSIGAANLQYIDSLKAENEKLKRDKEKLTADLLEAAKKSDLELAKLRFEHQDVVKSYEDYNNKLREEVMVAEAELEKLQSSLKFTPNNADLDLSVSAYVDELIKEKSILEWTVGKH